MKSSEESTVKISDKKKKELVNQILNSNTFRKATTSSALLSFLLEANLNGKFLKEGIIEIDFFGAKSLNDKNSNRVRVSIYNLRKKLTDYYNSEGVESQWVINIEKGHYDLSIKQRTTEEKQNKSLSFKSIIPYGLLLFFSILFIVLEKPKSKPKLWKSFLNNKYKTTLFIGDVFGIEGNTITGYNGWTRSYEINNTKQFYDFIEQNPDLKKQLHPAKYQFMTSMGVEATRNLTKLFTTYNQTFDIKYTSTTSFDDIKNVNAIYIGPLVNDNKFVSMVNSANPYLHIGTNVVNIYNHETVSDTTINFGRGRDSWEYAFVSKIPGVDNTDQMVFFSNHDLGVKATSEFFTNIDSIQLFEKHHLTNHDYFTAVFMAFGMERTNFGLKEIVVVPF